MAESLELQNELLSMKCCLCKNVLSVAPIMVLSEDGKRMKCGRCKNIDDEPSSWRNFGLESLAVFFSFPCKHEDCKEMIPWKEVESHEDACDKKMIFCPIIYQKCERIVQVQKLDEHLKCFHNNNIYYETQHSILTTKESPINFIISSNQHFITRIQLGEEWSKIYVAPLKKINEYFTYDLKLSSISKDIFITYENQPILSEYEFENCVTCILGDYPMPIMKVDLTAVKLLFGDISKIRYSITIVPKKEYKDKNKEASNDSVTIESPKNDVSSIDDCLKKQLQCPVCMEYMFDKIYNCEKGHVLCINCKIHLNECPSCRANLGESRNFPLENLADEVVFACQFSENGCEFNGKLKLLSPHEKECVHEHNSSGLK